MYPVKNGISSTSCCFGLLWNPYLVLCRREVTKEGKLFSQQLLMGHSPEDVSSWEKRGGLETVSGEREQKEKAAENLKPLSQP